jgi:alanine-glyoxylate transaminase/serine-glyoxylate transaminase/serine-pyruvate transaminase
LRSLACAVAMMHKEGLANVYARHALLADAFRAFVHATGCELAAKEPAYRSNTISAMELPAGISARDIVKRALDNDNVAIANGQDDQKDTVIRMGHMGACTPEMLMRGVRALARALGEAGMDAKLAQSGIDACADVLAGRDRVEKKPARA